jgi:hypothetical protein
MCHPAHCAIGDLPDMTAENARNLADWADSAQTMADDPAFTDDKIIRELVGFASRKLAEAAIRATKAEAKMREYNLAHPTGRPHQTHSHAHPHS